MTITNVLVIGNPRKKIFEVVPKRYKATLTFMKYWQHIPLYTCYNNVMICPTCSQARMVPIVYGYPTPELVEEAQLDRIVLGGTNIKGYTHFCHECQITYPDIEN